MCYNYSMAKQKFGTHRSVCSAALKRALDRIIELPSVDRIILGPSKGTRHNRPVGSVKLQGIMSTGVRMVGYGDRGVTSFIVITSNPEAARREIASKFGIPD
jgi:hypothetical protein